MIKYLDPTRLEPVQWQFRIRRPNGEWPEFWMQCSREYTEGKDAKSDIDWVQFRTLYAERPVE